MDYNVNPTEKQRKVAREVAKGKSVSQAMKSAGYSDAMAKNPQKLTSSKGWKELMKEYLPEEELAKLHREQLRATTYTKNGKQVPDNTARLKALELGYRVHGVYKPTQLEVRTFTDWTIQELEQYAEKGIVPERFKD